MNHSYSLWFVAFVALGIAGAIVALVRRPTAKKRSKQRRNRTSKPVLASARRKRPAAVARRGSIDSSRVRTHHDLAERGARARDVAAFVIQRLGAMTPMRLNRLIAICQAASISEDGRPLFADAIAASPTGPLPAALFKDYAGQAEVDDITEARVELLVPRAKERIEDVLARCGMLDEHTLNRLTTTSPWRAARQRATSGGADPVIDHADLADVWKMIAERLAA